MLYLYILELKCIILTNYSNFVYIVYMVYTGLLSDTPTNDSSVRGTIFHIFYRKKIFFELFFYYCLNYIIFDLL